MKRGDDTPEYVKRRKRLQRRKKRYMELREELMQEGVIPVEPSGAIRDERVDPADQGGADRAGMGLVRRSVKEGWQTPDNRKQQYQDELHEIVTQEDVVLDEAGNEVRVRASPKLRIEAIKLSAFLDQTQFERDNPEAAGKARGASQSTTAVSVEANTLAVKVIREMFEKDAQYGAGQTALPPPLEPVPPSHSRFDGEVETGAASTED